MSGENAWRKCLEDIFCRIHSLFLFFTLFDRLPQSPVVKSFRLSIGALIQAKA
jgi:hypothetical protein